MIEGFVPVKNGELYYREVGQGRPIIVIHGGPDFDHTYLLPELRQFGKPTLVIHGDYDFVPVPCAARLRRRYRGHGWKCCGRVGILRILIRPRRFVG